MNISQPISVILLLTALLIVACSDYSEAPSHTPEQSQAAKELPDQESWQSSIIVTKDGRRVADIWANYIAVYNKRAQTLLRDSIHVDFYNREGEHNSQLTAEQGIVDNKTKNLTAIGNVVVVSDSGIVLETRELLWDNQKQKVISQTPVKFTTRTDTLFGDSFISDPDLKNYEIRNARGYSKQLLPVDKE